MKQLVTWDHCVIHLNSDSTGSFYCGDIVTGLVTLEFKQLKKVEKIDFTVIGTSKAKWTGACPTWPHVKLYSEERRVLYISIDVFDNLQDQTVNPGLYNFPFHFILPHDLPSTFKSKFADVHYCIKLKSQGFCKQKKIQPLKVLGNVNLNHIEEYMEPINKEIRKSFWNNDTVSFALRTYKGFASKQRVPIEITTINEKKINLQKISVILIQFFLQKRNYKISSGQHTEQKNVSQSDYTDLLNNENETFLLHMDIPDLPPSSLHVTNPMIEISYTLRVQIKFTFHASVCEDIPVTVATQPVIHYDF